VLRAGVDGAQLTIELLNQGPGIAPEDISHVFDRYARAGRPKGVAGLGLGLYISKGIVEAHQGTIACRSTPGKTTVFSFTIPLPGN
jgi:signal transduction histidine kinase